MAAEINTSYIESHLLQALELAKRGYGYVSPNPLVGCVIANEGNVVSTGWHAAYGGPHAEASALQQLSPSLPRTNLTLYVTLEPCNHQGKQPPCTHAILNSGISSVVIGMHDPNPNVSGRGAEFLRAHGLTVVMASNAIANACRWLNRSWSYAVTHNRPYVIAKVAQSSDGYMAPSNHSTLRLTGNETQKVVHELRSQVDAVLVGMGTVGEVGGRFVAPVPILLEGFQDHPVEVPADEPAEAARLRSAVDRDRGQGVGCAKAAAR